MIIGVDVDDVVADLVSEWIGRYNARFGDNLSIWDVTSWDITAPVKPEAKAVMYDILKEPDLYANVSPISLSQEGVASLRAAGHRVVFVTNCGRGMFDQKWEWLVRHGFLQERRHEPDLISAMEKTLIGVDLMIDDKTETVEAFGSRGVLFQRPWNSGKATWLNIPLAWGDAQ